MNALMQNYLKLFRVPAIFTAMSNIFAGYIIANGPVLHFALVRGMLASACMLMAGMALNDIADRDVDAKERPDRPIPSGVISLKQAIGVSISLIVLSFVLVGFIHFLTFVVLTFLTLSILSYNFKFKGTAWGPLSMGICRAFNFALGLQLGFSVIGETGYMTFVVWWVLLSLTSYIALVTFLARFEVEGNSQERMQFFFFGGAIWLSCWGLVTLYFTPDINAHIAVIFIAGALAFFYSPFKKLWGDPNPENTGKCVGLMIAFIPWVDGLAILLSGASFVAAVVGLGFIFLARWSGKLFYTT